jgi:hypothetical protein
MKLNLTHAFGQSVECKTGEVTLFRYVYESEADQMESPMPYFHPICTLGGNEVTIFRPHDHRWHKGLVMTASNLSGQNFWGGPTYVRNEGYRQLENNGSVKHQRWEDMRCGAEGVSLKEQLQWITHDGETWISEERHIRVGDVNLDEGFWALELHFRLRNISNQSLTFGSPTTQGRPMAGYGGLFWRGPRSFLHGTILAEGSLEGPEVMGKVSRWLAYIGYHDGNDGISTILVSDHPQNVRYPNKWFVRNDPYGCISCAFTFDEEYDLDPGRELPLRYRIVFADGAWSRDRIENHLKRHPLIQ